MVVRLEPIERDPLRRQWLVFFRDCDAMHWWARALRPGFRHVCAAAWIPGAERWVFYNPVGMGTQIEVETDEAFGPRLQHLLDTSSVVLRTHSRFGRGCMPATFYCVSAVKALIGIRSRALWPHWLFRDLVAQGATIVWCRDEASLGIPQTGQTAVGAADAACAGGPENRADARGGAAAR